MQNPKASPTKMCNTEAVTEFLNIDLDIHGDADDVAALLNSIEGGVVVLRHEGRDASVELDEQFASPEETALGMIDLVGGLRPDVRSIWDRLERRRLDAGIRAACEPHSTSFALSARTIELRHRIHGLRATPGLTARRMTDGRSSFTRTLVGRLTVSS